MMRAFSEGAGSCRGISNQTLRALQVAELEAEAAALFDRISAAEEEAGAAEAGAHATQQQLQEAHTQLQARSYLAWVPHKKCGCAVAG